MRRIVLWGMSTLSALVLLFSYHTSTSSTVAATSALAINSQGAGSSNGDLNSASAGADQPATGGGTASEKSTTTTKSTRSQTFAGAAMMTRYGNVQVQITVVNGKVTAAQTLQVPMEDRHDQQINSQAVPVYNGEVVDVQSAKIDVVSGATVTWGGYTQSLQSALDQAHL